MVVSIGKGVRFEIDRQRMDQLQRLAAKRGISVERLAKRILEDQLNR